jgi:hypothetical protein
MLSRALFSIGTFALGGLLGWSVAAPDESPPAAPATTASSPPPFRLAAWDWRQSALPPALSSADSTAAIAAWLALRGPDGAPAPFPLRAEALHALLARLPPDLFASLLTPLAALGGTDDTRLFGIAFNLLTELDPAAAARWAAQATARPGFEPSFWAGLAVQAWARLDPTAATAWVLALPDPALARALGGPLLAELGKTDPGAALQTLGPALWQNADGYFALRDTLTAWGRREPAAALAWLLAQDNQNNDQLTYWIGALADPPEGQTTATLQLFALLDAITARPAFAEQRSASRLVMVRLGQQDPAALLTWLSKNTPAHERDDLLRSILNPQWGSDSPATSLTLALGLPLGTDRTRLVAGHLKFWAERDPAAALAWVRQQDAPDLRAAGSSAQAAILGVIARDEPATAAAEWQSLTDARTRTAAVAPIVENWATRDPAAALAWLRSLGPELETTTGVLLPAARSALFVWSQRSPEDALNWAQNAAPAHRGDYLRHLADDPYGARADRAAVSDLYAKITDPALRSEVLAGHVREWLTKDRPAAQAWLEATSALTPEQAAALLAPPQP